MSAYAKVLEELTAREEAISTMIDDQQASMKHALKNDIERYEKLSDRELSLYLELHHVKGAISMLDAAKEYSRSASHIKV